MCVQRKFFCTENNMLVLDTDHDDGVICVVFIAQDFLLVLSPVKSGNEMMRLY